MNNEALHVEAKNGQGLDTRIESLETLIKRRFDELSMEINATSQLIDMAEETIGGKFSEILQVLNAVGHYEEGAEGATSSNSGYELDAVVDQTEKATTDIMDAAERIETRLKTPEKWEEDSMRPALLQETADDIRTIMMSCSFQDLTGQRIHKAVNNIREAEKRLYQILEDLGLQVKSVESLSSELRNGSITSQADIDTLFANARKNKDA